MKQRKAKKLLGLHALHRARYLLLLAISLLMGGTALALYLPLTAGQDMPDFPAEATWLNGEAKSWEQLRGKVVLVDFWTFACWNCYRSFPWLNDLEQRLADEDFQIIGVHTPEFEREKVLANVKDKIAEFGLQHPVMIDNDMEYWNACNNRYWPAFYLVDKEGRFRGYFVGETHGDTPRALQIENAIQDLLAE